MANKRLQSAAIPDLEISSDYSPQKSDKFVIPACFWPESSPASGSQLLDSGLKTSGMTNGAHSPFLQNGQV